MGGDMTEPLYKITFAGKLLYGFNATEVRNNLAKLGKYDDKTLDKLFSGQEIIIKKNLNLETAKRYKAALDKAGARCQLVPLTPATIDVSDISSILPVKPDWISCPKCGAKEQREESCTNCGILFSKFQQMQERLKADPDAARPLPQPEIGYFERHLEQLFILKAFAVILGIIFLREFLSGFINIFLLLFPVLFLFYVKLQAAATDRSPTEILAEHITFMPVMYATGERKNEDVAWVTYGLILINVLIFYGYELNADPEFIENNLLFMPLEPNFWNVPVGMISSIFLHANSSHLWGNMLFLWAVGTVVERRLGWVRHLSFYMLTGIFANLLSLAIHKLLLGGTVHGLGASGAISGVMGVYAIRCYFKSMVFPLPILGIFSLILPISLKVRLNSLVIIGLFFLADLSGGIGQLAGEATMIGHWAHIGGMICGIGLAAACKLNNQAVEERHMEIGREMVNNQKLGMNVATGEESLRLLLKQNPENADALLLLAKLKTKFSATEEGAELYPQAISQLIKSNRLPEAADAFLEFHKLYMKGVEANMLFRLAAYFNQNQQLEQASRCLELLCNNSKTPAQILEKSLYQYIKTLNTMGFSEAAKGYYQRIQKQFPDSPFCEKLRPQFQQ